MAAPIRVRTWALGSEQGAREAALRLFNAVVLWNTRYIDAAVASLRAAGYEVSDEDVARLSPLGHAHINMLGRYSFAAVGAGLRPLRDPAAGDDEASA